MPFSSGSMDARDPFLHDEDPGETREWVESIEAVLASGGPERAHFLMRRLRDHLQSGGVPLPFVVRSPYVNTIPVAKQPAYPGDLTLEKRIRRIVRWNAAVMVHRANKHFPGIGGHLSTYASAAMLYEVGFNHIFRSPAASGSGDQVFFQGHAAPGVYARAFLEGRLDEGQLERFRREATPGGLSSYPHPRLMPEFWEFSTVSMGLGPLAAIYQARFNRYLHDRGFKDTSGQRVWAFLGDGETDEPEALGALALAAREKLDNLVFIVNCNLQRLDGPVRGNGKIIQELDSVFGGAGWNVVKVIWGTRWDALLDGDHDGLLRRRMDETVDGEYQKYAVMGGAYIREHFFGKYPKLAAAVQHLSDDELRRLNRGGHDPLKVFAAFDAARNAEGRPTVILAKTVKGYTLGDGFEARNATHQMKKLGIKELRVFRDRLELPIDDDELEDPPFYHPGPRSPEVAYVAEHRRRLGGPIPWRRKEFAQVPGPAPEAVGGFDGGSKGQEVSTTTAFVHLLQGLLRDPTFGRRIVPIVCDEARTFGMEALFKPFGIYSSVGQLYTPVDAEFLTSYRESKDGQLLQEGISEAGSLASFIAASTSYATHGELLVPMFFFYSMFGFQRVGDMIWQAADMNARGFLLGCTAGRTTLNGEGLQHADGHSLLIASAHPAVVSWEPTFAYEIAAIVRQGLRCMVEQGDNVIYYMTLQNEAYEQAAKPVVTDEDILAGAYLWRRAEDVEGAALEAGRMRVQLLGSGTIFREVRAAQETLVKTYGVAADLWSVTSYTQLRRDAMACDDRSRRGDKGQQSRIQATLGATEGPIIAASDWMRAVPDQIAPWLGGRLTTLGTDGFGLSDTREALRRRFEVDAAAVVGAVLWRVRERGC